jgi:hypothetical protein
MASMQLGFEFAYNNPAYTDAKVVITTEPLAACRARLAGASSQPRSRKAAASVEGSSAASAAEVVEVNRMVLGTHSMYFRRAVEHPSSMLGTSKERLHDDAAPVLIMSLASEALFPTAHSMICFMYLRRLDDGIDKTELLQLFKLADEYDVPELRHACLEQLNKTPLVEWTSAEMQLLQEVADSVASDSLGPEGVLQKAAQAMIHSLAAHFTKLEEAWRSQEQREIFCSLPYTVVVEILGRPDLVVKSENTVLVVALSWLRSARGQRALLVERRKVLLQVRMLQLSPWFLAALLQPGAIPEALQLLQPQEFGKLVRQLASPATARITFKAKDPLLQTWSERRPGAAPGMTLALEVSMGQAEVVEAVAKCRADADLISCKVGDYTFFDGLFWSASIQCDSSSANNKIDVWSGLEPQLFVGSEFTEGRQPPGMLDYPCNYLLTVGNRYTKVSVNSPAACALGSGWGRSLAKVGQDDNPQELLRSCFRDGKLTLQAELL